MSLKSQAEDPINNKTFKTIIFLFLTISLSIPLFIGMQKGYANLAYKTKLEEKLSQDKILTFFINGFDEQNLNLSVFIFLQPIQRKCGMFFINPISTFEDKKIETMGKEALPFMIPKIEAITGLKINFYINMNDLTITEVIDLFEGLPFYLDTFSAYPSDNYKRNSGLYTFSGEELNDYTNFIKRDDPLSYVNRINTQESLALSFYDRIKEKTEIRKEWFEVLNKKMDTNLNGQDLYSLYSYIKNNHIIFSVSEMPGELILDSDKKILKLLIHDENANFGFSKLAAYLSSGDYNIGDLARTEVLNSTEKNGLAKSVKSILNENSIKVLSVGNGWNTKENKTIIIDRSGSSEYSYKIARLLGIKNVHHLINKEIGLDTTVLLGEDFEIKPGK
jgi:polyisoprenyl-teichoic acid--peptidoglycan teichoic acid transferase